MRIYAATTKATCGHLIRVSTYEYATPEGVFSHLDTITIECTQCTEEAVFMLMHAVVDTIKRTFPGTTEVKDWAEIDSKIKATDPCPRCTLPIGKGVVYCEGCTLFLTIDKKEG